MARGRLLKSKKREAYAVAKATEEGKLAGQQKAHKKKELVEELREHIGKAVDAQPLDVVLNAGLALAGYQLFKDWKGALVGPIALKLACADNLIAAAAGVTTLVSMGVAFVGPEAIVKAVQSGAVAVVEPMESWADSVVSQIENFFNSRAPQILGPPKP